MITHTINAKILTMNNTEYESGVYVKHMPMFYDIEKGNINIQLNFFKDKASSDNNAETLRVITKDSKTDRINMINRVTKNLSQQEINILTPVIMAGYVKTYLESIYGTGNVVENV